MNDKLVEVLTKVYGYVNQIKIELSFKNLVGVWKVVNDLSDYLFSVDVGIKPKEIREEGKK